MKTISCIGCGNMGAAILRGLAGKAHLLGYDRTEQKVTGCGAEPQSIEQLAKRSDIIIVAVKPYGVAAVLGEIAKHLGDKKAIVVSVAAGISLKALQAGVQGMTRVVRCMPNTPVAVGMGAFGLVLDDLNDSERQDILELFGALGMAVPLAEADLAPFTALMGCGPAYVFYMMEAMTEAAVVMGMSRARAIELSAYLFAGSAKLAMQPGAHPSLLREAVCSPAGSTIEGVLKLDEAAVRTAVIKAVQAGWTKEKSREV